MFTVAKSMVKMLVEAGVKRIYGIVGDSLNGIIDEIRRQKTIEWVHVRHEEVAALAVGADAHVTGELAVLRRELRPWQPSSNQRTLRLPSKRRACACNCGSYSERRGLIRCGPQRLQCRLFNQIIRRSCLWSAKVVYTKRERSV
jgi:hypothetical protein